MSFKECIRRRITVDPELSKIHSLVLFGSYIRGDFVPGLSDLDILVIVGDEAPDMVRLHEIIGGCVEGVGHKLLDLPWERLENLRDPLNMGYGFKFLTIYLHDFLENHEVVYGEEVAHLLPRYDMDALIRWRTERLSKLDELIKDRPDMAPVVAGEVCRLMALISGAEGISKQAVLDALKAVDDKQATDIYESYVKNRKPDKGHEYYVEFIESRIRKIESNLSHEK
ncbi:MAG: nucleotidyltransferase domain-containing protein [Candidatus Bathyarchaeota archaeon]